MADQVTGFISVDLDGIGRLLAEEGSTTLKLGSDEKSPKFSNGRRVGSSRKTTQGELSATLIHVSSTDLEAIRDYEGDIRATTDTGQVWVIPDGERVGELELSDSEGTVSVTFGGGKAFRVS